MVCLYLGQQLLQRNSDAPTDILTFAAVSDELTPAVLPIDDILRPFFGSSDVLTQERLDDLIELSLESFDPGLETFMLCKDLFADVKLRIVKGYDVEEGEVLRERRVIIFSNSSWVEVDRSRGIESTSRHGRKFCERE